MTCRYQSVSFPSHLYHRPVDTGKTWLWWHQRRLYANSMTWISIHQGQPGYSLCWVSNLPAGETNTEPLAWHSPQGDQPATWWQIYFIGLLPSWKRQHFVLTGRDNYSEFRFVFPACNISAKTTICGLTECFIHRHGIPHSIASNQGIYFTVKEGGQWAQAHGIHSFYHVPPPSRSS